LRGENWGVNSMSCEHKTDKRRKKGIEIVVWTVPDYKSTYETVVELFLFWKKDISPASATAHNHL
jgi:hypothetical protein